MKEPHSKSVLNDVWIGTVSTLIFICNISGSDIYQLYHYPNSFVNAHRISAKKNQVTKEMRKSEDWGGYKRGQLKKTSTRQGQERSSAFLMNYDYTSHSNVYMSS